VLGAEGFINAESTSINESNYELKEYSVKHGRGTHFLTICNGFIILDANVQSHPWSDKEHGWSTPLETHELDSICKYQCLKFFGFGGWIKRTKKTSLQESGSSSTMSAPRHAAQRAEEYYEHIKPTNIMYIGLA